MPLGCSQVLSSSLFSREDIVLEVSLVGDISSWGVSGDNKRGAVWGGGLPDAHLLGALPHHGCEMAWKQRSEYKADKYIWSQWERLTMGLKMGVHRPLAPPKYLQMYMM